MCRRVFSNIFHLSRPVESFLEIRNVSLKEHFFCSLSGNRHAQKYVMSTAKEWIDLVKFMFETQSGDNKYTGIKGLETLKLDTIKHRVTQTKTCLVYRKRETGNGRKKLNLILCNYLPNLSIRLKIMARSADKSINPDNEYADQFVRDLNEQLRTCWRVVSQLFHSEHRKTDTQFLFVREFEKVTCALLLVGYQEKDTMTHDRLKEFGNLKRRNFDFVHENKIRKLFPDLNLSNLAMAHGYKENACCDRQRN